MSRLVAVLLLAALLSACVTRKYDWDGYDAKLYRYYKDPSTAEVFRTTTEAHLKDLEGKNLRPAPGLYAELGTLYLERGDVKTAAFYYAKERDAWPESRHLMSTLLASLEKMGKGARK